MLLQLSGQDSFLFCFCRTVKPHQHVQIYTRGKISWNVYTNIPGSYKDLPKHSYWKRQKLAWFIVNQDTKALQSHDILPFLTTLINSSLTSGLIPTPFKAARVKPLLKKPTLDSANICNYTQVSLLSFLSKTLESTVYNQLYSFTK